MTTRRPPCALNPAAWDHDPGRGPHPPVAVLVHACRTVCPIYDQCKATADPSRYGVLAGEYRPWPTDSRLLMANAKLDRRRVADALLDDIRTSMKPGDEVPEIDWLARRYGVDRTVAFAALRTLAREKYLTRPRGYGHPWKVAKVPTNNRTENAA